MSTGLREARAELVGSELAMDHWLPRVCPVGPPGSPLPSWSTCEAGPLSETPCLVECISTLLDTVACVAPGTELILCLWSCLASPLVTWARLGLETV